MSMALGTLSNATTCEPALRISAGASSPAATTSPESSISGTHGLLKGRLGSIFIVISVLNCNDTCDTRIRTSDDEAAGIAGVGWSETSLSVVFAGPRRERTQARMVGGTIETWVFDGISSLFSTRTVKVKRDSSERESGEIWGCCLVVRKRETRQDIQHPLLQDLSK
jgi:hypothetical protein